MFQKSFRDGIHKSNVKFMRSEVKRAMEQQATNF